MDKLDIIILLNIIIIILIFYYIKTKKTLSETFDDNKQYTTYYDVNKNIKI